MSKGKERSMAVEMRERGLSYTEILEEMTRLGIKVSRGSLSNWLKRVKLSTKAEERIRRLEEDGKKKGRDKIIQMRLESEQPDLF